MEMIRFQKNPIKLDVRNLFLDGYLDPNDNRKIDNFRRSIINEHIGSSRNSEDHYTEINEGNASPNDNTEVDETITEGESVPDNGKVSEGNHNGIANTYLSLSEDISVSKRSENSGIYSYAKNEGHDVIRCPQELSRDSENLYLSLRADSHYDSVHHDHDYDENRNTYLVPKHQTQKADIHANHYRKAQSERAKNSKPPRGRGDVSQPNSSLGNSVGSGYCMARVSAGKKKGRKSRIMIVGVILAISLIAASSVLTWYFTRSKEEDNSVKCKKYPDVPNGHVKTLDDSLAGSSSVNVSCYPGFKVNGNEGNAMCQSNGTWDIILECKAIDCGKYVPPDNVRLTGDSYDTKFNTTLSLACDTGFELAKNTDNSVWCDEKGIWSGNPKCVNLVDLSVQPSFILIGNSGTFACNFRNISNWQRIEIKGRSSDNETFVVVSTDHLIDSYDTKVSRNTIRVTESKFTHNSGQVNVVIDSIQCSDVFGVPGDVTYECSVHYDKTFEAFDRKLITIQGSLKDPSLTLLPKIVEGHATGLFVCEMYFAEPNGHVIIENDYDGEVATLLTTERGEYETDTSWIERIKASVKSCWYQVVVTFGLKSVSMQWHRKHIRCVAEPAATSRDQTVTKSEFAVVKVIPENFCLDQGNNILQHPYNCSLDVVCGTENDKSIVKQVSISNPEPVGSCSITDFFIKYGSSNTVGSSLTMVCVVEDFKGLLDIKITRDNGELVASINKGHKIKGFTILQEESRLNVDGGVLSLFVEHLICSDKGAYRCSPEGTGTPSEDNIHIDLNCDGN